MIWQRRIDLPAVHPKCLGGLSWGEEEWGIDGDRTAQMSPADQLGQGHRGNLGLTRNSNLVGAGRNWTSWLKDICSESAGEHPIRIARNEQPRTHEHEKRMRTRAWTSVANLERESPVTEGYFQQKDRVFARRVDPRREGTQLGGTAPKPIVSRLPAS